MIKKFPKEISETERKELEKLECLKGDVYTLIKNDRNINQTMKYDYTANKEIIAYNSKKEYKEDMVQYVEMLTRVRMKRQDISKMYRAIMLNAYETPTENKTQKLITKKGTVISCKPYSIGKLGNVGDQS